MAPGVRSLTVRIVGDVQDYIRKLQQAEAATSRHGKALHGAGQAHAAFGRSVAGAAGVLLGGAGLVSALHSSIDAAVKSQEVQRRSEQQLKALGISYEQHAKQIESVIQKQSQLSALDDEDLQSSFTNLVRVTKDVNRALELNGVAADVARGKNVSLEQATMIVTKASLGQLGALKRMGVEIPPVTAAVDALKDSKAKYTQAELAAAKAADATATRQQAVQQLQRQFAGQAEAYGKTAAGAQDRLRVASENLRESIGEALLPTVEKVANGVSGWLGKAENLEKVQRGVNGVVETATKVVGALWPQVQRAAGAADAVAKAVGGWDKAFMLVTGGLLASKMIGLANSIGGRNGLTNAVFRATLSITGKGGLLGALSAIPAAIATSVIVTKVVRDLTGSESAGNVAGGAAGGAAAGGLLGKVAGNAGRGVKAGGPVGAVVGALVNPDSVGAGLIPVWDGARWAGVSDAGQAYWTQQRAASGLGSPVAGLDAYTPAPIESTTSSKTTAIPRSPLASPGAVDRSSSAAASDGRIGGRGGGGGRSGSQADAQTAGRSFFTAASGFKPSSDIFNEAARDRAVYAAIRLFPSSQVGPLSGFSTDSITANHARTDQQKQAATAAVQARIDAMKTAVDSRRQVFAQAFSQLGEAATRAITAKYAQMQKALSDTLTRQLKEIEQARAELTPAERELAALQEQRDEQARQDALAAAQASGDAKQLADAQYAIRVAALSKQAQAERRARDADAAAKTEAAQAAYTTEKQRLDTEEKQETGSYTNRLKWLEEYLAARKTSVAEANTEITALLGEFSSGLDRDISNVIAKLGALRAAGGSAPNAAAALAVAFPDFRAMASGGDMLVTRPTLFLAGEAGPERATFSRLGGRNYHSGGQTIVVNVAGSVVTERDLTFAVRRGIVQAGVSGAATNVVQRSRTGV